jgi:predicted TIM-barrel fold metal-dependent hydrolase
MCAGARRDDDRRAVDDDARRDALVVDAWIQPWTQQVAEIQPPRNFALVERYGGDARLTTGITLEAMVAEMDAAGVDVALCSAGPLVPVTVVEEAVRRYPDRLLGVGYADPFTPDGVMVAVDELRRQVEELGFVGLKLEPFIDDHPLTDRRWYPLYAACHDLGITLQVQVGNTGPPTYPSEPGRPLYVDRVAIDFPELRIVAGHIGWPWTEEMIAIAQKHPKVWIDTSAHVPKHYPERFVHFLRSFGRDKCCWGSDWPILGFDRALRGVADLGLAPAVERRFLCDNTVAAFALGGRLSRATAGR